MDLEFQGLSKRFGSVWANRDISLTVKPGTIVGLLGPNGAGKTTLLRQLVGLTRSTSGQIVIGGRTVVAGKQWVKETIAYLPQHPLALGDLTVEEAIRSSALLRGQPRQDASRNTEQLLEAFDLQALRHRQVAGLSGGEHRLVGIASVVVAPTPVLALDEPTNELDPLMRRRVWDFIDRLRNPDRIVLLVSHNVLEAERVLDRVLIMSHGQIRHDGHPHDLRGNAGDILTVSVTAPHDATRLAHDMGSITDRIYVHPPTLEFTAPRPEALTLLAAWLAEPGLISSVSVNEPSLEDAYLALRDSSEENTP
ncbi:ABC transporter ATP-binding protein [Sulfobacillus harzensis]|uniref:ABC transporter ATP-binding protein n=1 Tax=Sulfobacillus harzensis TaxID=2729629 RepID=A0A7Y0L7T3_9FIRM|nr:ABC transporter ATP-binding protein [Sulfobacillus harzensis]NMP24562.1 ABC transporter ATP-binding protein [Sulfobacillus harzensis]